MIFHLEILDQMRDTVALNRFQETVDYTVDIYSDIDNSERKVLFCSL